MREWLPIKTAPKDGTRIDLLYPYPRGRTINCFWKGELGIGWAWLQPTFGPDGVLPEDQWDMGCYLNLEPTHWMPIPPPPRPKGAPTMTIPLLERLRAKSVYRIVPGEKSPWDGSPFEQCVPDPDCAEAADLIATLTAALAAEKERADAADESGWVIEGAWSEVSAPSYWCGSSAWSDDHMRALRFARKEDAEQAAFFMLDGMNIRIAEHIWTRTL